MPKTKSRSDLEITYSYAKNTISHLGTEEGKMVANHTHFKNLKKKTHVQHAPIWALKTNSHDDMNIQLCLTDEQMGDSPCLLMTFL
jgi:hypothetical protein